MLLKYFKILYIVLFQEFLINFVKAQNFKEVCSAGVDTCTESCKSFCKSFLIIKFYLLLLIILYLI
ncbi:hypothetical protein LY90DRAFT_232629 [Neocallimastix californiae]|uniref:Uncharacterized protein n=1 Tax=Neocallimastix californiae TaxID=1754190 RepID=A0A1Y1YM54_9FUNG|nr:hypothetical protein LY90DRAFT_232629 [Neocallimastix californiae]|eukprot:ORX99082.1 hypothetical protein LY90DRAFT_232629 [Neocallimastix californiae]